MSQKTWTCDQSREATQIKTCTRWVAKQLKPKGIEFNDISKDFSNGVNLIILLETLCKESIGRRYNKNPRLPIQKQDNVNIALDFIKAKKVISLVSIGSEDIVNGNVKLILGMTCALINKFRVKDISVDKTESRDGLLVWAKKDTQGFEGADVVDFSKSWRTGLPFCAIISKHHPLLLDYYALNRENANENCQKAFEVCKKLGIYTYIDPEDICQNIPDEMSIITQVAEYYHFFASEPIFNSQAENMILLFKRDFNWVISEYKKSNPSALLEDHIFMIDSTGSMARMINFVHDRAIEIATMFKKDHPEIDYRCGTICYRDPVDSGGDQNNFLDFAENTDKLVEFLAEMEADGGGDGPEDYVGAFTIALNQMHWREGSKSIMMFADSPAHGMRFCGHTNHEDETEKLVEVLKEVAHKGIFISGFSINGGATDCFKECKKIYDEAGGPGFKFEDITISLFDE